MAKVLIVARDFFAQAACHKAGDVQLDVVDARTVGHRKPAFVANDSIDALDYVLVFGSDANYVVRIVRHAACKRSGLKAKAVYKSDGGLGVWIVAVYANQF